MGRSFQKRRGKPRLDLQLENSKRQPKPNKSVLSKIKIKKKSEEDGSKGKPEPQLSEKDLQEKLWKHVPATKEDPCPGPIAESSFSTRYPESRDNYVRAIYPEFKKKFKNCGIELSVDVDERVMTVTTTSSMFDPYSIIKARDVIRLISRYVPMDEAFKLMTNDDLFSDIIEIGKSEVARHRARFIKRRARLIGPNGVTLKAIEVLTKCYVLVFGRSVCAIGPMNGIKQVRQITMDCMANIHPIYQLKRLMVLRELQLKPELKNEDWSRYLPTFKKLPKSSYGQNKLRSNDQDRKKLLSQIRKTKRKMQQKNQKRYTPWPPAPVPSKIDIALETGEYWDDEWRKQNLIGNKRQRDIATREKETHREMQQEKRQKIKEKKDEKIDRIKKITDAPAETNYFNYRQPWRNNEDKGVGNREVDEIKQKFAQRNKKVSDHTESNVKNYLL